MAFVTVDRFHADEALYAGWALAILDGDPLLLNAPVDKPPLYLYTLAGSFALFGPSELAARLPNLSASLLSIALIQYLGRQLYNSKTGTWAALLLALSPFDILFARTAFTDSLLVAWTLAALCAMVARRWFLAGISLSLAFATKQHALLIIPLVLAAGLIQFISEAGNKNVSWKGVGQAALLTSAGFLLPFVGIVTWDAARWATRPGYWQQSAMSYGGLVWSPVSDWGERWIEWLGWSRYLVGSSFLASLAALGCLALVCYGWLRDRQSPATWFDTLWSGYLFVYLAAHTVLRFSIWDRYLLPLAPLVALLLARMVALVTPSKLYSRLQKLRFLAAPLFLVLALISACKAAGNGYPIGGEHWAYQGLDEIVAYLEEQAPPNAVLYHHWLRWHYSYYLYDTTFELRWWESGEHMQREALRTRERAQYVVLPDWRTLEPDAPMLRFELLYQAHREDGSVSLSLYRVYPQLTGCLQARAL